MKTRIQALEAVRTILEYVGEDPGREGLLDTPERVVKSWDKLYGGYKQDPGEILSRSFQSDGYDQMVILGPIEYWSTCEHHMLPFYGSVSIGYLPGPEGKVVGVSKLARVVEVYARRLQIQERFTQEVARAIEEQTGALGVGVVIRGQHMCMVARGVEKQNSVMTTSDMRGAMRDRPETRMEFLNFTRTYPGE